MFLISEATSKIGHPTENSEEYRSQKEACHIHRSHKNVGSDSKLYFCDSIEFELKLFKKNSADYYNSI